MRKLLALFLLAALTLPATGETTRFWRQQTFADFEKGTAQGVALRSDGELLLAPRFQEIADPNLEYLWAVAADERGNVYMAGGSPAKVVRLGADGQAQVVFESKELEVHALALGADGTLYAATSPDGSVYRIPRQGEATVLYTPGSKYLWDLVQQPDGTLLLATGDKGEIFRITPDGQGAVFFSSEETHMRSLALAPDGTLYAGTEPNGLVLRISPQGEGFVLYETAYQEVTALRIGPDRRLYVAAIGQKSRQPVYPGVPQVPVVPTPQPQADVQATVTVTAAAPVLPTQRLPFLAVGGSEIYRIAPDGYPEVLWTSQGELVYSLDFDRDGRLLAGTGNEGKLVAIDSAIVSTRLVKSPGQQITRLLRSASGRVLVATANPGKLFALGPELATEGTFESEVFDAQLFSQWGRLSWQSREPTPTGSITLYTRTGNTLDPAKNWSPWSDGYAEASGTPVASPAARFLQWKAVLRAVDSRTPGLSGVAVAYLRRNVAPVVENILIQEPGVSVQGMPRPPQQVQPVQLNLPPPSTRQQRNGNAYNFQAGQGQTGLRIEPPPQGITQPGVRSVVWSADDENDDDLKYAVYYRGEGETRWKLMKEEVTDKFYTWDAATLPDGAYTLKVVASDAPSNPPAQVLTGENVSDRFEVDNTPPGVEGPQVTTGSSIEVSFLARDSYSPLKKAEYSVDAGEWKMIFPESGTTDAREHRYRFRLEGLGPGEHTVVVRVYDRFENPALAKATFTLP